METARTLSLVAAIITTGLVAGLFYSYACSVMLALRQADDATFVDVMQRINTAILNGWFALGFVGALLTTALTLALHLTADERGRLLPLGAALVLYVAVIAVTRGVNIPLNNRLDAVAPTGDHASVAAVRRRFEAPWVRWNLVRTLLSAGALGCLCWALALG